jgi:hypothetical protein
VVQLLRQVIERTGIGADLEAESAAMRKAEHRAFAERLQKANSVYLGRQAKLYAEVEGAEAEQKASQAAVEKALERLSRAYEAQSTNHDTLAAVRREVEPQLKKLADPRIEAFKLQLRELHLTNPQNSFADHDTMSRRARAILNAIDAAERLKLVVSAEDLDAEFGKILATIPVPGVA